MISWLRDCNFFFSFFPSLSLFYFWFELVFESDEKWGKKGPSAMCRVDACDSPARKHLTETTPRCPVPSVDVGGVNHPLTIATFFLWIFLLHFFSYLLLVQWKLFRWWIAGNVLFRVLATKENVRQVLYHHWWTFSLSYISVITSRTWLLKFLFILLF